MSKVHNVSIMQIYFLLQVNANIMYKTLRAISALFFISIVFESSVVAVIFSIKDLIFEFLWGFLFFHDLV